MLAVKILAWVLVAMIVIPLAVLLAAFVLWTLVYLTA